MFYVIKETGASIQFFNNPLELYCIVKEWFKGQELEGKDKIEYNKILSSLLSCHFKEDIDPDNLTLILLSPLFKGNYPLVAECKVDEEIETYESNSKYKINLNPELRCLIIDCDAINITSKHFEIKQQYTGDMILGIGMDILKDENNTTYAKLSIAVIEGFEDKKRFVKKIYNDKLKTQEDWENYTNEFLVKLVSMANEINKNQKRHEVDSKRNNPDVKYKFILTVQLNGLNKEDKEGYGGRSAEEVKNCGNKLIRSNVMGINIKDNTGLLLKL